VDECKPLAGGNRSAEVYGGFLVDAMREGLRAAAGVHAAGGGRGAGDGAGAGAGTGAEAGLGMHAAGVKRLWGRTKGGAGWGSGAGLQAAGAEHGAAPDSTEPEATPQPSTTEAVAGAYTRPLSGSM